MRKTTERYTKSLLSVAALLCVLLFAGCDGPLTDEDLSMSLLKGKSNMGLSLLDDEEEGKGGNAAIVGTWLIIEPDDYHGKGYYVGGHTFNADGTYYDYDDYTDDISLGGLRAFVTKWQSDGPDGTWAVSGDILTMTEVYTEHGEVITDNHTRKFVISGNTLTFYRHDKEGNWASEPEDDEVFTKYNF